MSFGRTSARRWGLRVTLLAPVVGLVVAAALVLGLAQEYSEQVQIRNLADNRGAMMLEGILEQLAERHRVQQAFADLLAHQTNLADAVEAEDPIRLAQLLVPLQTELGLDHILVYSQGRKRLLDLAPASDGPAPLDPSLLDSALSGMASSATMVDVEGLAVFSSRPIKGPSGIVGALIVGSDMHGGDLGQIKDRQAAELAVYQDERLTGTTTADPDLRRLLAAFGGAASDLTMLNRDLAPYGFRAEARPVGDGGLLLALTPITDLNQAARQRRVMEAIGVLMLIAGLMLSGLLLSRRIAEPLKAMATTTRDMVRGNYQRRVPPSGVRELNSLANSINYLAQQIDIQLREMSHQAFHDLLTGLPNRALFVDRLNQALARAERRRRRIAVAFLDLDNFKVVNDSLGHATGDQLLIAVAQRLRSSLRPEDTAARLGGDEFAILIEDIAGVQEAVGVVKRLTEQLRTPFMVGDREVFATSSVGIAVSSPGDQPDVLLRYADTAMYRAKANGKAGYEIYDQAMKAWASGRLELETDLRRALERDELRVEYQPVVRLSDGRVAEVEALVRWSHPRRGLVMPVDFVPLAEETGLIIPIGMWVLERACRDVAAVQRSTPGEPLTLSVNLSAKQLRYPDVVREVARVLKATGFPATSLKLEITESIMMQDADSCIDVVQALRDLGVRLAVDDFGTGYSSLSYLSRLPVDALKIDRSFVERLGRDPDDLTIVRAIITLAKALNLAVTGEGIETEEQLQHLRDLGCDLGQGFLFAKSLTLDELQAFLPNRH